MKLGFKFDENVKYCPNQNESPKYLMEFQPDLSQNDEIGFQIWWERKILPKSNRFRPNIWWNFNRIEVKMMKLGSKSDEILKSWS